MRACERDAVREAGHDSRSGHLRVGGAARAAGGVGQPDDPRVAAPFQERRTAADDVHLALAHVRLERVAEDHPGEIAGDPGLEFEGTILEVLELLELGSPSLFSGNTPAVNGK